MRESLEMVDLVMKIDKTLNERQTVFYDFTTNTWAIEGVGEVEFSHVCRNLMYDVQLLVEVIGENKKA